MWRSTLLQARVRRIPVCPAVRIYPGMSAVIISNCVVCGNLAFLQHNPDFLFWRGQMVRGTFRFDMDTHLYHLAQGDTTEYEIYRPYLGGWVPTHLDQSIWIVPGHYLIYRPRSHTDRECRGLGHLVRNLHNSLAMASPYENRIRIPGRYHRFYDRRR